MLLARVVYFHKYYWNDCLRYGLSDAQTDHLKEALTFLLNEEFMDLFGVEDAGYPMHKTLRKELRILWKKTRDFDKFLPEACRLVKNRYSEWA